VSRPGRKVRKSWFAAKTRSRKLATPIGPRPNEASEPFRRQDESAHDMREESICHVRLARRRKGKGGGCRRPCHRSRPPRNGRVLASKIAGGTASMRPLPDTNRSPYKGVSTVFPAVTTDPRAVGKHASLAKPASWRLGADSAASHQFTSDRLVPQQTRVATAYF